MSHQLKKYRWIRLLSGILLFILVIGLSPFLEKILIPDSQLIKIKTKNIDVGALFYTELE